MTIEVGWPVYATGCIVILAGYYVFVWHKYFWNNKMSDNIQQSISRPSLFPEIDSKVYHSEKDNLSIVVTQFREELTEILGQLKSGNLEKETLIQHLKALLNKYSMLNQRAYRQPIGNLIVLECEQQFGISLTAAEQINLWP